MFIASIDSVNSVKSFLTETTMSIEAKMPNDFNFILLCSNGFFSLFKYGIYKKMKYGLVLFVCLSNHFTQSHLKFGFCLESWVFVDMGTIRATILQISWF